MPIAELIKGNETAIIAGSFTLLGVIIASVFNVILRVIENMQARKLKRLELAMEIEKTHLLEPTIEFIDHDLAAMQDVYSLIFVDRKDRKEVFIDNTHIARLPSIQARLRGLGDPELNRKFRDFSNKRIKIGTAVEHRHEAPNEDPYEQLQQAIDLAGEILNTLFKKLKNLKS